MSATKTLSAPLQYLKGVGPKRASALSEAGLATVRDLLAYYPRTYLDLSRVERIAAVHALAAGDRYVTVVGSVRSFDVLGRPPRRRLVVVIGDDTGTIPLVFFQSIPFYRSFFTPGETIAVSGRVTAFRHRPQMVHPSIDRLEEGEEGEGGRSGFLHTGGIVPIYRSSQEFRDVRLETKGLRRLVRTALDEYLECVEEHLPPEVLAGHRLAALREALRAIHFPASQAELEEARRRLKFDELFSLQLLLALRRRRFTTEGEGIAFRVDSRLARTLVDALPFTLTPAQVRVIKEIAEDMKSSRPMNRLLQGDVGSGKTVVALIACLIAVDNGYQAAFMAPTEILAEQHFRTISGQLGSVPVTVRLLVSGQNRKLREDVLEDVRGGGAGIVVGTHALIQEGVAFARLGLAVIDEQHRFGVDQRMALREKGREAGGTGLRPDVLIMTATPIPRTLALAVHGDLDISTISELPAHRTPVATVLKAESQRGQVTRFVEEEVRKGRQAYIVYPLVAESEKSDLKAAVQSYELLKKDVFPGLKVGLLHGQMDASSKESVMGAFQRNEISVLAATTVVEVGIDVPNATVMVIEHAERFGLSQLHQMRGRVGRGPGVSTCILMAPDWMAKRAGAGRARPRAEDEDPEKGKALRRLETMLSTSDGFKIAEIDLELRGPGDFFGTQQSGVPEFRLANLVTDGELLSEARSAAFDTIESDPQLRRPDHQPLRKYFLEQMRHALDLIQVG